MAREKPIEQLADDVKIGDAVWLNFKGIQQGEDKGGYVGIYLGLNEHKMIKKPFKAYDFQGTLDSLFRSKVMIRVKDSRVFSQIPSWMTMHEIKVGSYEILRRAKNKEKK